MWYSLDRALYRAITDWDFNAVVDFVEAWADINYFDHDGTPLERACLLGDFKIVKYLVEKNVDLTDKWEWLSLLAAAQLDDLEIFNYLIEKGAIIDPNYGSWQCGNILVAAAYGGHRDLVKTCVEKWLNINEIIEDTFLGGRHNALYYAKKENNVEMIKFLLENWIEQ